MPLNRAGLKKSGARSRDTHQWQEGDNVIRILPPTSKYFSEDIDSFDLLFFVHYNLGPEGTPPVTCPRTFDERAPCPACAAARKLWRNDSTKDLARDINRKLRYLINMIDITNPNGIEVAEIGKKIHDPILAVALNQEVDDILDIVGGRHFRVNLKPASKATGGYPEYSVMPAMKPSNVKSILDTIPNWKAKLDELAGKIPASPPIEDIEKMVRSVVGDIDLGPVRGQEPKNATVTKIGDNEFSDEVIARSDSVVKAGSTGSAQEEFAALPETMKAAPQEQAPAPQEDAPRADGKPPCWGDKYQPHTEKCKGCAEIKSCMNKFTE
jgi:hypothetical protein